MAFYIVLSIVSSCINWAALIIDHVCPILDIITKSFRIYQICETFLPPANEVWGKVIFLHLFVILFTGGYLTPPWEQTPPGTRYTPLEQTPPRTRYTPPDQVHPPRTRYTPPRTRYTPQEQTPPWCRACWEIRSICGWYASYWNAILYYYQPQRSCGQGNVFT